MSVVAPPAKLAPLPMELDPVGRRHGRPCSDGGRPTLEQRISSVWEGLLAAGAAGCPVCGGRMEASGSLANCEGCGSVLS